MHFKVRITLPEAPDENLVENIPSTGFTSAYDDQVRSEGEYENIKEHFSDVLVTYGIIASDRRGDLLFDFVSS